MKLEGKGTYKAVLRGRNSNDLISLPAFNNPPTGSDFAVATLYETAIMIPVLDYVTDLDQDDVLSIDSYTQSADGVVTQVGDELHFTPNQSFSGAATFSFTVTDGNGFLTLVVTVNVGANGVPVGVPMTINTGYETSVLIDVLQGATDPEGHEVSIADVDVDEADGTAVIEGGQIRFTPNPGYSGETFFYWQPVDEDGALGAWVEVSVDVEEYLLIDLASAIKTDGSDDFGLAALPVGSGVTKATISVFVKVNSDSEGPSISLHAASNNRFELSTFGGVWYFQNVNNGNVNARSFSKPANGIYHVLAVYDASLPVSECLKLYLNGVEQVLGNVNNIEAGSINSGIVNFYFGRIHTSYNKSIQTHVAIALGYAGSLQDAQALWNNGVGADYREVVGSPNLYYELNENNGDAILVDSMGFSDMNLNNFSGSYIVDFNA